MLFSQSVDPGQQFTWENSNMEVNKPKNRYANVIAYDHSRVVLTSVDGKSSRNHLSFQLAIKLFCHWLSPPTLDRHELFYFIYFFLHQQLFMTAEIPSTYLFSSRWSI